MLRTPTARRRRVLMPLLVLGVVALVVALLARSGQRTQLLGSGSTLAQPLIETSASQFRRAVTADDPQRREATGNDWVLDGSGIDYEPVGSLGGVMRLDDPEVDFAVTDYPLSTQLLGDKSVAQFPVAIGAVAVVHTLDLPAGRTLTLDAATLAAIYLGRITRWDDPALVALNPGVTLPGEAITAVHRVDGSGSTFGFTRYLAAGSPDWASGPGAGALVTWPAGVGAERSSGLVAAVTTKPFSIGYVEQGQATRAGLRIAQLRNGAGAAVPPSETGMRAAVAGHDWSGDDGYAGPLRIADDPTAYPMTVAVYAVLKRDPRFRGDTDRTLRYLTFLVEDFDAGAAQLGYLPLPGDAGRRVVAAWQRVYGFAS